MNPSADAYKSLNPWELVREAMSLYRESVLDIAAQARSVAQTAWALEKQLHRAVGSGLCGKRVLIVGSGQMRGEFIALSAMGAQMTGIDLDVVPLARDLPAYLRLLRVHGPLRLLTTFGSKVLGIDAAFEIALKKEMGVSVFPPGKLIVADATLLPFPNASFDVIYSASVFENLPDPIAATREVHRVLAPGGFASIVTHISSSKEAAKTQSAPAVEMHTSSDCRVDLIEQPKQAMLARDSCRPDTRLWPERSAKGASQLEQDLE